MPKEFDDLATFVTHLASVEVATRRAMRRGLEEALVAIEADAKARIGHYQGAVDQFPEWAPLAASTEEEKARLGYPPDAPLLRTGDMRDSIKHEVESDIEGVVGSTDPVMAFHELGTPKMPPRPVLGPAAFSQMPAVQEALGRAIVEGLVGGERVFRTALPPPAQD